MQAKKIGIIGTSSAGKTTLCYEVLWKLKRAGILCDGVLQQDRRFSFDRAKLDTDPLAQWSFIANQIKAEADMAMRPGIDILVSDRSPLDLYAYHVATHGGSNTLYEMCIHWCAHTFDKMYMLRPLKFENDGVRPSEKFRDKVADILLELCTTSGLEMLEIEPEPFNVGELWRQQIPSKVLAIAGKILTEEDLSMVPEILNAHVLIGGSYAFNRATKWSDLDVYILEEETRYRTPESLSQKLRSILGIQVEVHFVEFQVVWDYLIKQGFQLLVPRS